MIEKLTMQTLDIMNKNVEQIGNIFPEVITEIKDKDGKIVKGIDFDLLKQKLSSVIVEDENERYRLDWPGKKASLLKANIPINKTLRPVTADGLDFELTKNIYIEGDNFEVLKILQESYLGKVKLIYIDPPYNTGNDYIYKDDFKKSKEEYEEEIGMENDEGEKLFKNTDSNGRFHSDWITMVYERLIIARDLLKEDGIIFISISDKEFSNLKSISSEIFGEENFIATLIWDRNHSAQAGVYKVYHEYILVFAKNSELVGTPSSLNDDHFEAGAMKKASGRHSMQKFTFPKGTRFDAKNGTELIGEWGGIEKVRLINGRMISENEMLKEDVTLEAAFTQIDQMKEYFYGDRENLVDSRGQKIIEFYLTGTGKVKVIKERGVEAPQTTLNFGPQGPISVNLAKLFDLNESPFDSPKPVTMIEDFISRFVEENDIVLDFFGGSSTTAHAVFNVNAKYNKSISFIIVQYPESLEKSLKKATKDSVKTIETAIKYLKSSSLPLYVTELGKERIRRAGKKIKEEFLDQYTKELEKINEDLKQGNLEGNNELEDQKVELESKLEHVKNLDVGFRVYKTDSSNMKDIFYHPTEFKQEQLAVFKSNIKEDRTPEDLLTQVILDLGLELSLSIEKQEILGNNVFIVQENALVTCFDDNIDFGIVDKISDLKPFKVVFKDSSFKDDKDRINVEERFKRLSPETKVTVI